MESSDTTKCFPFLSKNIPSWLDDVAAVEKKIKTRRDEAARMPVSPQPKRTGSNESIRINDDAVAPTSHPTAEPSTTASPFSAPSPQTTTTSTPFDRTVAPLFSSRKRKTTSVLSNSPSIPTKYRTRTTIVVYYDSEVQKAFEQLVRNIGIGRNLLRKGKMQARMNAFTGGMDDMMSALSSISGISPSIPTADAAAAQALQAAARKIEYAPRSPLNPSPHTNGRTKSRPYLASATSSPSPAVPGAVPDVNRATGHYDALDKRLEQAQSFAEKGAHEFLRDGECPAELAGLRSELQAALDWCREAVAAMEAVSVATKEAEENQEPVETPRKSDVEPEQEVKKTHAELSTANRAIDTVPVTAITTIEVDSDIDDEIEISLPPIRRLART